MSKFIAVASDRKKVAEVDLRAHFKACFGMDYPVMLRRLQTYVEEGRYRYLRQTPPTIPPPESYSTRPVPLAETRLRLAELALRTRQSPMANYVLVDAATRGATDARVFEVLGTSAIVQNDENSARKYWEQALTAGSVNGAVNRELGLMETRLWMRDFNYSFRLPAELRDRLRSRLRKAIEHEPRQSAAYEQLAMVEAFSESPMIENVNLVQEKFAMLKEKQRTAFAFALIRLHMGKTEEGLAILKSLETFPSDPWTMQAALKVGLMLENQAARAAAAVAAASPAPTTEKPEREITGTYSARFRKYPSVELPAKP